MDVRRISVSIGTNSFWGAMLILIPVVDVVWYVSIRLFSGMERTLFSADIFAWYSLSGGIRLGVVIS